MSDGAPANAVVLPLTQDDLLLLSNALNEVLNGLEISESETRLGVPRSYATELSAVLHKHLTTVESEL